MPKALCVAVSTAVLASATFSVSAYGAPTLTLLSPLPGRTDSAVQAVSADGSTVVGWSDGPTARATLWTLSGVPVDLGAGETSYGRAVSADGSVVVGERPGGAYRWTAADGAQSVGGLAGANQVTGTSADGSVIVGTRGSVAVRWTAALGTVEIVPPSMSTTSAATGVSADGSVVIGVDGGQPFRWTQTTGAVGLGMLPGATPTTADGLSADGSTVVGSAIVVGGDFTATRAFRWSDSGGMIDLGLLPGFGSARALSVSGNGSVVVGRVLTESDRAAFIWSAETGMLNLHTYLQYVGVNLTGWTMTQAEAVSADGSTVAGTGLFNGEMRGFVVSGLPNIPAPGGGFGVLAAFGLAGLARRRVG